MPLWKFVAWVAYILFSPFDNLYAWWLTEDAAHLDGDWRRWLFGAALLILLVVAFVGFCFLATLILPKHGR